jgi:hypothetical protein
LWTDTSACAPCCIMATDSHSVLWSLFCTILDVFVRLSHITHVGLQAIVMDSAASLVRREFARSSLAARQVITATNKRGNAYETLHTPI